MWQFICELQQNIHCGIIYTLVFLDLALTSQRSYPWNYLRFFLYSVCAFNAKRKLLWCVQSYPTLGVRATRFSEYHQSTVVVLRRRYSVGRWARCWLTDIVLGTRRGFSGSERSRLVSRKSSTLAWSACRYRKNRHRGLALAQCSLCHGRSSLVVSKGAVQRSPGRPHHIRDTGSGTCVRTRSSTSQTLKGNERTEGARASFILEVRCGGLVFL